jgi:hypothetical protein
MVQYRGAVMAVSTLAAAGSLIPLEDPDYFVTAGLLHLPFNRDTAGEWLRSEG